ncbi:trypsin-1-like [Chironomus tepperi]|uniref:trypsin-1-like n=1 Tax=Chironomus tepperi TaxID=113505 RepID=UPI00391F335B
MEIVVFRLISVFCVLLVGCAKPQYNTFNPQNPFLNNIPISQQNPPQSDIYYPSDPVIVNNNSQPSRLSEQKCEEYWKRSRTVIAVGSLSLYPVVQNISDDSCDSSQGLIVGGENAKKDEFPHMAALGYMNIDNVFIFICGGSLISDEFVLTAAHCRYGGGGKPTLVRLGVWNLKIKDYDSHEFEARIKSFIVHENYNPNLSENDIAVIKLSKKVRLSKFIRPACLMTSTERIQDSKIIATGWGLTNPYYGDTSEILQKVELSLISNDECSAHYEGHNIFNTQLCAGDLKGGKDTCRGDSGGPLQIVSQKNKCIYLIIGVTSYGAAYCGGPNSPGVYTRVSEYVDWIEQKVWGSS